MRSLITWAVRNMAGMNVLVVLLLVGGFLSFYGMRRETFPEFQLEVILVTVPYPGATPDEVESGICQKIEESIQAISGIKKLSSICREGSGFTLAQLESNVTDPQKILSEIRSAVDRVSVFFPNRSEKATVEQITFRLPAIRVAVLGPENSTGNESDQRTTDAELRLRNYTELVRERLLESPSVSQAKIQNEKPFQIDVEISEATLRKHGLTLAQVAQTLRRENLELPGGQLKSDGQEILLRGKNKRDLGEDIATLPILSQANGVVLNVSDLGTVRDAFDDVTAISEVNGRPAMVILIERTSDEDLLNISDEVNALVSTLDVPEGYAVQTWGDESEDVRDRMRMLRENGMQGGAIVFLLLAIFLNLRLAFWVALGIPISLMGAGIYLLYAGETLNMLTMFAFLMAVGIVIDDAIVIGENIYEHRMMGKSNEQAAIDGALEVLPSVFSSIATTIVAFLPLFYVSGVMGKFIAVMPTAIIAMLLISLAEATFVLPGHLASRDGPPKSFFERLKHRLSNLIRPLEMLLDKVSMHCNAALEWFGKNIFLNVLKTSLRFPLLPMSVGVLLVCTALGMIRSGWVPFEFFPQLDGKTLIAQVVYPDGTPAAITSEAARRMEQAVRDLSEEIDTQESKDGTNLTPDPTDSNAPRGPVILTFLQVGSAVNGDPAAGDRISGSHIAQVQVEIHEATLRNVTSSEIIKRWREKAGNFPGAERVSYETANMGPGGKALEFKILAPAQDVKALEAAIEASKKALSNFAGVSDIRDDSNPGKIEYQFSIKDEAMSLGLTNEDLSETVRNSYYGAEVMRLQRGRHEVKLMVRYPIEQRRSLSDMQELRVRGVDGKERPLSELADVEVTRGYSEINRLDQLRSITVSADVDTTQANAALVAQQLQDKLVPELMEKYPSLRFRWEGQQQETAESFFSLLVGFIVALMTIYLLLVFEFRSYLQPLIIISIIPFSIVGAIFGHAFMGLPLTLFSMFGMVTLAGVVVNDSIVLVDFINQCIRDGMPVDQALLKAGSRRLRAVFLTSVTTVAGLFPMLMEKSLQAQALIPMATSLAFGLIGSTLLVLVVVPMLFKFYTILTFSPEQLLGKRSDYNDLALAQS